VRRSPELAELLREVDGKTSVLDTFPRWVRELGVWYVEWCAIAPLIATRGCAVFLSRTSRRSVDS
jgi:hypothetical protein